MNADRNEWGSGYRFQRRSVNVIKSGCAHHRRFCARIHSLSKDRSVGFWFKFESLNSADNDRLTSERIECRFQMNWIETYRFKLVALNWIASHLPPLTPNSTSTCMNPQAYLHQWSNIEIAVDNILHRHWVLIEPAMVAWMNTTPVHAYLLTNNMTLTPCL